MHNYWPEFITVALVHFLAVASPGPDFAVMLRQALCQSRRNALLTAFSHLGKPYDYDFDFRTDNALVCSEVIYRAYQEVGLFEAQDVGGRVLLPPNAIAELFDCECEQDDRVLDFVFFLDGMGATGKVLDCDAAAFRKTWQRPKWHVLRSLDPIGVQ